MKVVRCTGAATEQTRVLLFAWIDARHTIPVATRATLDQSHIMRRSFATTVRSWSSCTSRVEILMAAVHRFHRSPIQSFNRQPPGPPKDALTQTTFTPATPRHQTFRPKARPQRCTEATLSRPGRPPTPLSRHTPPLQVSLSRAQPRKARGSSCRPARCHRRHEQPNHRTCRAHRNRLSARDATLNSNSKETQN